MHKHSSLKPEVEISSNLSVSSTDCESPFEFPEDTILLIDPWSTGDTIWNAFEKHGFRIVVVWENDLVRSLRECNEVLMHTDLNDTVFKIKEDLGQKYNFVAVVAGSETAVPLAEKLAVALDLPTNPPTKASARRNKYLMGEALRTAGVRAVQQKITTDIDEATKFVENELVSNDSFRVIVKPNMGAGSDDVYLCTNKEDFLEKFQIINGKINSLGIKNDGVLVQEYLSGVEYVVDSVSIGGKHQVCAIWQYDKRNTNGRFNVYHGTFPVAGADEVAIELVNYVHQVLDALDFVHGPSHAEIKLTPTGPCLVEIGARCHGGAGSWLQIANKCFGMNQVDNVVRMARKQEIVSLPEKLGHFGAVVDMLYYEAGELIEICGDKSLKELESLEEVVYYNKVGDVVKKTVDCNTHPGHIVLMHSNEDVVRRDFETIHKLFKEKGKMFNIQ